jgi:hypothetical protein
MKDFAAHGSSKMRHFNNDHDHWKGLLQINVKYVFLNLSFLFSQSDSFFVETHCYELYELYVRENVFVFTNVTFRLIRFTVGSFSDGHSL